MCIPQLELTMTWLFDLGECYILLISILYANNVTSLENAYFLVCGGFSASICSNEALPWDVVDGFSKERSSLRYFRILIQTQKVLHMKFCCRIYITIRLSIVHGLHLKLPHPCFGINKSR